MATSTLKILRVSHDYTQDFVADHINVEKSTYSRMEVDPSRLSAVQAEKLCKLYNISLADLLSETGPTITFNDSIKNNTNGSNGYHQNNTNNYNDNDSVQSLKEMNALLLKQNGLLLENPLKLTPSRQRNLTPFAI